MSNPSPSPDNSFSQTESFDSILIVVEGPGDKTRRPRRRGIPYIPPEDIPPLPQKPNEEPADPSGS